MDHAAFDGLTRRLASRRGIARLIAGLAAAPAAVLATHALPAAASPETSGLRCGKLKAACTPNRKCCDGYACKRGVCRCPAGTRICTGSTRCENLAASNRNCGACGNPCKGDERCSDGVCCLKGTVSCGGACCKTGLVCVPKSETATATCCARDLVFVLCPDERIVLDPTTSSSYCDMSATDISQLQQTCCPATSVCPGDGLCCVDPDTNEPVACNVDGFCPLYGVAAATYTPPVKGRN